MVCLLNLFLMLINAQKQGFMGIFEPVIAQYMNKKEELVGGLKQRTEHIQVSMLKKKLFICVNTEIMGKQWDNCINNNIVQVILQKAFFKLVHVDKKLNITIQECYLFIAFHNVTSFLKCNFQFALSNLCLLGLVTHQQIKNYSCSKKNGSFIIITIDY